MKQPNKLVSIVLYVVILAALLWGLSVFTGAGRGGEIAYSAAVDCFRQGRVEEFVVGGDGTLTMRLIFMDANSLESGTRQPPMAASSMSSPARATLC